MVDVTFEANHSARGGAISCGGISTVTLFGRIAFRDNSAPDGGACYITTLGKIEMMPSKARRVLFTGNRATGGTSDYVSGYGGVFHMTCGGIALLNGCDFVNNSAALDGGVIDAREARVDLEDCSFLGQPGGQVNRADRNGGAIALRSVDSGGGFLPALFCNRIPSLLKMNRFSIAASRVGGRGGAVFAEYADKIREKITQFSIDNGTISRCVAVGGLNSSADGIYLHDTGEDRDTNNQARRAVSALNFGVDFASRYLAGVRLRNLDVIQGVKMTGRGGLGAGITVDHVCNENVTFFGNLECELEDPDVVLVIENCEIQGFGIGVDALESSRLTATSCRISGNDVGMRLDHCIADVVMNSLLVNALNLDVLGLDDLRDVFRLNNPRERNVMHIQQNTIAGGITGIRFDTNVIRVSNFLLSPNIRIELNNLTGHSPLGSFGIEVRSPEPGFAIDAIRNWWGSSTGPNPPSSPGANPNADNVSRGVNYPHPLQRSHGKP